MLKSILVPLDHKSTSERRIMAATTLGQKFGAHIQGVHVLPTLEHMMQTIPYMPYAAEVYQQHHQSLKKQAKALLEHFEHAMTGAALNYDRVLEEGDQNSIYKFYSRCADLTLVNQEDLTVGRILNQMSSFVLGSGLPVMALPENMLFPTIGERILVAWNDSAQCARATHDALPFLREAEQVTVLSVGEYDKDQVPTADICQHLSRHNVNVEGREDGVTDNIAETILMAAEELNVDLIVAGAWGHSRITEVILGGVTQRLFSNKLLPVFLSH
ncbi:universal stress protein [Paremcibacter congregatus]|jgi:nucleotide-binding universal stress UspA family protein|uniref:universal stress protein n=1 Tax=Paremcibacter congregatus TaxID=2043170 RepID=UPI0030EB36B1|tara:strand:- start:24916 stop:25731 length:816 start_codon:yes stop_codon:yes gene_type:complete